ncbi:4Fe-4S binding protein [candidate division KSB1 bacterium]|nr:4Fe-4S binding protein [candidate division KSB1 bacterium]
MKSKIRILLQTLTLFLIIWVVIVGWDIETFCPMGGLLSFGSYLYQETMACSMSSDGVFMAFALIIGALLIGKLFCSYFCPIGYVTEWLGKLGRKFNIQMSLPAVLDRLFRIFKYALLFVVLYYTVTSSELFCKKFDPYYGVASGFDHDVVLLWSLAALAVTILGAIFFKQFWCKYLCPLGAATNMFVNIYLVFIPFAYFFAIRAYGIDLSIAWLFGALAVVGFAWEIGVYKLFPFPLTKITVDQNKCTHCSLCVKACPQGIKVDEYKKVDHPDCMLCTECVYACKSEQAVGINGSRKLTWIPPTMAVALPIIVVIVLAGMRFTGSILSTNFEFRTLKKRWGNFSEAKNLAEYKKAGIKNIKCYGTSLALYKKLKDKKGIYGLDTYAKSHAVTVYYDPEVIDESGVKKAVFDPLRYKTRKFTNYKPDSLAIWQVGIENFFDRVDNMNLIRILHADPHVFGFETNYGEPVQVSIFYCSDSTNPGDIRALIDTTKRIEREIKGKIRVYEMDFTCENAGKSLSKISTEFYTLRMFGIYDQSFNGYETKFENSLKIYEIGINNIENIFARRRLIYLVSHISEDSAIVRLRTSFDGQRNVAQIFFDPAEIDTTKIHRYLVADTLRYFKADDSRGKTQNIFKVHYPSRLHSVAGYTDPVQAAKSRELGER